MKRTFGPTTSLVLKKEEGRRAPHTSLLLAGLQIKREEQRRTHQREEDRYRGVVADAWLYLGIRKSLVQVENISSSGAMITAAEGLKIGQRVRLKFEEFEALPAVVRWIAGGKAGLEVPKGSIQLYDE